MDLKSAVLANFMLNERLRRMGILGCVSCIVGSVIIVIHAPQEHTPSSVQEVWNLATQPGFYLFLLFFFFLSSLVSLTTLFLDYCLFLLIPCVYSVSDLCVSYIIHSTCADDSFRASIWTDKHTGLLGDLFLNGGPYGN